ncbi:MAG: HNH endonuclease [Polyangiaceae bacterium]|nr:HNH endonuclease [Polyangiaceae bacterium]
MPAELRATLAAILAQSCSERAHPDPRYAGQTNRDPLQQLETKLLIAALSWAGEQLAEPQVIPPQPREILPLPKLVVQKPVAQDDALSLEDPRVQFGGGLVSGGAIGAVPLGSPGAEVAIQLRLLPQGTYWAQVGRACGEIVVGTGQIAIGCAGMGAGAGMSSTGGGAIVGVPIAAGSFAIATNGCATLANGVRNAGQLLSEGAPPEAPPAPSQVKLLEPKAKPATQPPPPAKPPAQTAAKPAQTAPTAQPVTKTTTKDSSGRTIATTTTSPSGTRTTTRVRQTPPGAQAKPLATPPAKGQFTPRNAALAGKRHPKTGVPFDMDGYPDFRAAGLVKKEVKIKNMKGTKADNTEANRMAKYAETPEGFVWHHHQDCTTMQLVPEWIHRATGHTGGGAIVRHLGTP